MCKMILIKTHWNQIWELRWYIKRLCLNVQDDTDKKTIEIKFENFGDILSAYVWMCKMILIKTLWNQIWELRWYIKRVCLNVQDDTDKNTLKSNLGTNGSLPPCKSYKRPQQYHLNRNSNSILPTIHVDFTKDILKHVTFHYRNIYTDNTVVTKQVICMPIYKIRMPNIFITLYYSTFDLLWLKHIYM